MGKKKAQKFPKEILVKIEPDGDIEYLVVVPGIEEAAEPGLEVPCARYALVEVGKIVAAPEFVP